MDEETYDPKDRVTAKRLSRERDEADLASGRTSAADLQSRNRFLKGFDPVAGRIRKWRIFK